MKNTLLIFGMILVVSTCLVTISHCTKKDGGQKNKTLVAYTNLSIIDGVSSSIRTNQTIIINTDDGIIEDIFTTDSKQIDSKTTLKDMTGKVMMPGLIEGHFHLASTVGEDASYGKKSMRNMFTQGITAIRDMAGNGDALLTLKNLGNDKKSPYPKVYFSCLITGQSFIENDSRVKETAGNGEAGNEPWFRVLNDHTDANELIASAQKFGCSGLKLYADISADNVKRMIKAAKKQGMPVWSHGTVFDASPWDIAGSHSFSHADFFSFVTIDTVPDYKTFRESYTETFELATIASSEMQKYFEQLKQDNTVLDATLTVYEQASQEEQDVVTFAHEVTKSAFTKGVKIGAGVDKYNDEIDADDYSLLHELILLKDAAAMTDMDLLKAATINNAIAIGIDDAYGSIEKGKKADLIILHKNPLSALENLKSVYIVIKDGYEHTL